MQNAVIVTSVNKEYYDNYGHRLIDSYKTYLKDVFSFHLYNEDFNLHDPNIKEMNWDLGKNYHDFQSRWKSRPRIQTFAKKAYSIIHALNNIDCDKLIWIDSDCIITSTFTSEVTDQILDDKFLASYFGVYHEEDGKEYFSCETGFFVINKRHKDFNKFLNMYENIYNNDMHQELRRFYDGEVFGNCMLKLKNENVALQDLSPIGRGNKRYKTPIRHSVLAPFILHHKGKGLKVYTY